MCETLFTGVSPEAVAEALAPLVDFQDEGLHIDDLNLLIEQRLLPLLMRYDLPAFQGLFNSKLEEGALLGAEIGLEWNQGVTNWQVSPGGATLEEMCCKALCRLFGLGPDADATVLYCGTYANQQALSRRQGAEFGRAVHLLRAVCSPDVGDGRIRVSIGQAAWHDDLDLTTESR